MNEENCPPRREVLKMANCTIILTKPSPGWIYVGTLYDKNGQVIADFHDSDFERLRLNCISFAQQNT